MIEGIIQLILNFITELARAFGHRNYHLWSNTHSASSRQLWGEPDERQPLQQEQQQEQHHQQQQPQPQEV